MIAFTIPIRTSSKLNQRLHHYARASVAKKERGEAKICALSELNLLPSKHCLFHADKEVTITMTRVGPRELDDDNVQGALKSIRDGIADALAVAAGTDNAGRGNDNEKRMKWVYCQRNDGAGVYAVEVVIK